MIQEIFKECVSTQDKKINHHQIVTHLRSLIEVKERKESLTETEKQAADLIDQLCFWRNTQPDLLPSYVDYLKKLAPDLMTDENLNQKSFYESLMEIFKFLENSRDADDNKIFAGRNAYNRDPRLHGFLSTSLYKVENTNFMLAPRITIENEDKTEIQIDPEFINYLKTLRKNKQKHLLINFMKRVSEPSEKKPDVKPYPLTAAIEELEKDFSDVLIVVTLDKKSDFYDQTGEKYQTEVESAGEEIKKKKKKTFEDKMISTEDFKQIFMSQLYSESPERSQYKLPIELKDKIDAVLNQIHEDYFLKENLNNQERRDFIEMSYVGILELIRQEYIPVKATCTGRFTMNEGPDLLELLQLYTVLKAKGSIDLEDKKSGLALLLVPPIIGHNRLSNVKRFDRLGSSLALYERRFGKKQST